MGQPSFRNKLAHRIDEYTEYIVYTMFEEENVQQVSKEEVYDHMEMIKDNVLEAYDENPSKFQKGLFQLAIMRKINEFFTNESESDNIG